MSPQLLVSVRSAEECQCLAPGTCDIVDIKEPQRGSLGAADPGVIRAIVKQFDPAQCSIALGEVAEWTAVETVPELPRVGFHKLGLAGLAGRSRWRDLWEGTRRRFNVPDENWVAVAYADAETAGAPDPGDIVDAAVTAGCRAVLIDTYAKAGAGLFDWLSVSELRVLRDKARAGGLTFAVAGQLRWSHAEQIARTGADVVGIRGAACLQQDRQARIHPAAIAEFREALNAAVRLGTEYV